MYVIMCVCVTRTEDLKPATCEISAVVEYKCVLYFRCRYVQCVCKVAVRLHVTSIFGGIYMPLDIRVPTGCKYN